MLPSNAYLDVPLNSWPLTLFFAAAALGVLLLRWFLHWPASSVIKKGSPVQYQRASGFRPDLIPSSPIDTIVIGSGSGGCACANLLAQSGRRVLLLEQHMDRTGGCTHSFRIDGCEWDTGLHYTSAGMGDKCQRPGAILHFMTKGKQEFTRLADPYDDVLFPKDENVQPGLPNCSTYSFVTGGSKTVDSILENIDPSNEYLRKQMLEWMDLCRDINDGFTALGISRVMPSCLQFLVRSRVDKLYKYASYTVRDVQFAVFNLGYTKETLLRADSCPKAPAGPEPDPTLRRLKAVLTHPIGDYAVQPRDATFAAHGITQAHYLDGACYTVGATQNMSIRTSSMVRQMGGEALVDATVRKILIEDGRAVGVVVSNTSKLAEEIVYHQSHGVTKQLPDVPEYTIRAKNVVCATSIYNLYNKFLPQDLPIVQDFHHPDKRSVRQSNGHVFLFCKLHGSAQELGLPKHNLWYFNGYDLDQAFDEYFSNPEDVRPPTVYIGFPCTKDPTWSKRFPKVSNCILISDGLWEWFEKWADKPVQNRGEEYEAFKAKLQKHLLDILYESVPQVKDKVEFSLVGTPLSEVTFLSSWHGGSYGTMCNTDMFAPQNRGWTTTPHTTIKNLYMAGSDAFLPAVCGAMYGGCFGATAVLGHLGTLRLLWAFLGDFASSLREEHPKLWWPGAYKMAVQKFLHDD